jgi:Arylsulfotransferase (ASST)
VQVDHQRRLVLLATAALIISGLFGVDARVAPAAGHVSFTSTPSLFPDFSPRIHDYVVRCRDGPVTVEGHLSRGWEAAVGDRHFRRGDFKATVLLRSGQAFTVIVRQVGHRRRSHYHVRCLPDSFPKYTYIRYGPVSPKYFAVTRTDRRYGMVFNNHGVPIWWIHAPVNNASVRRSGNILWFNPSGRRFEIHRLDGSLVRTLDPVGLVANIHDLQFLPHGDYLVGSKVKRDHVDTSAYGGSSDATVVNTELQQVSPDRQLVWDWKSQDHISLEETGRWWRFAIQQHYDVEHWNSIEPAGGSVIASFRHLDAVYKIRKSSGEIVWKLGGTTTPQSLQVRQDPYAYTFGGQHDARLLPDGTLTVFDNRTYLDPEAPPRAVRFAIDETTGTATLLQSITDPDVPFSDCCGSARLLSSGDWLIDWGSATNHPIGGYESDGERTFLLTFNSHVSYRAEPVPAGVLTAKDLRRGMRAMCSSGCD